MAKLNFVRRARKNYSKEGIVKGQSYWWFKFPRSEKVRCAKKPRRSVYLTKSEFIAEMLDLEDEFNWVNYDVWVSIAERVRELGSDCQKKYGAIERLFPNGCPTMELLRSRIDTCTTIAQEIEDAVRDADDPGCNDAGQDIDTFRNSVNWEYE